MICGSRGNRDPSPIARGSDVWPGIFFTASQPVQRNYHVLGLPSLNHVYALFFSYGSFV